MKLGLVTLGLVLGLSATAAWPQSSIPTTPEFKQPEASSPGAHISELRPSSIVPTSASITLEQLYTLINERDRQYQQRFEAQEKAVSFALIAAKELVQAALISAREAVTKAETANEKRLDSVNEFRAQQQDLINTFMPRAEMETRFKSQEADINRLTAIANTWQGRAEGVNWVWVLIGALVGGLLSFGTFILTARDSFKTK